MISRIYTIKVHFYFSMPRYSDTLFQPPEGEDDFCQNKMWTSFWHVIADVFYSLYLQRGGKTRDAILKKMLFHFKNWTSWNVKYSIDPLEHQSRHHLHAYILYDTMRRLKRANFESNFFVNLYNAWKKRYSDFLQEAFLKMSTRNAKEAAFKKRKW